MSHFSVLVIGGNIDEQLAPFHEFECTGCNDQYIQDVDITDEFIKNGTDEETGKFSLEEALSYYGYEDKIVGDLSEVDKEGAHKYGYVLVQDGKVIKAVDRTNPNAKWDWYLVGGRWTGYWRMKEGVEGLVGTPGVFGNQADPGTADSAFKRDIDFDGMMEIAGIKAGLRWDKIHNLVGDMLDSFIPWTKMRDEIYKGDIETAREVYHQQPVKIKLVSKECYESPETFMVTREQFVEAAKGSAVSTFAVIKDGVWYEKGTMGWWGAVSNEEDSYDWCAKFAKLLEDLPDDTLLTVVDCHI